MTPPILYTATGDAPPAYATGLPEDRADDHCPHCDRVGLRVGTDLATGATRETCTHDCGYTRLLVAARPPRYLSPEEVEAARAWGRAQGADPDAMPTVARAQAQESYEIARRHAAAAPFRAPEGGSSYAARINLHRVEITCACGATRRVARGMQHRAVRCERCQAQYNLQRRRAARLTERAPAEAEATRRPTSGEREAA